MGTYPYHNLAKIRVTQTLTIVPDVAARTALQDDTAQNYLHLMVTISYLSRTYECMNIFTARKRSLGQGNIFRSVCQEFCPQKGCLVLGVFVCVCVVSQHALRQTSPLGRHPLGQTPPWADTPGQTPPWADTPWADTPWADTSLGRHPLVRHPLGRHPPGRNQPPWADTPLARQPPWPDTPPRHPPCRHPPWTKYTPQD